MHRMLNVAKHIFQFSIVTSVVTDIFIFSNNNVDNISMLQMTKLAVGLCNML